MKRFLFIVLLGVALLGQPTVAQEQDARSAGGLTIANLNIAVWPEFDRPDVLVIYRGQFASDTQFPVPVEFRIPASAGQPTAVAYVAEDGGRYNQNYTTRSEGDALVVSFELATPAFQLEYYDPLSIDPRGQRTFEVRYSADYAVTTLDIEFQVPPTSQGFTLDPSASTIVPEADGLLYHVTQAGPLEQGERVSWTLSYQKEDEALTVDALAQPEAPVPTAGPTGDSGEGSAVVLFVVAFLGLIGVGAGAFWLGRRTQADGPGGPPPPLRAKRRGSGKGTPKAAQTQAPTNEDEVVFCHRCGAHLRDDADFCYKCGVGIRRM
jgi:hypothetical protein